MKKVDRKKKVEAVKDYLSSGQGLLVVSARHGISVETLRKAVGPSRIRKRGKRKNANAIASSAQATLFPASVKVPSARKGKKNEVFENSNKRWSRTEVSLLVDSVNDGLTAGETAKLLGRSKTAVMQRKHLLISQGVIPDPLRFPIPDGIKRVRKEVIEAVAEYDEDKIVGASTKIDSIDLVDLADLAKRFGLNVTITISGEVTTVNMHS